MIIDGTDLILGRMASKVAAMALSGEEVTIINVEKVVISGRRDEIFKKYKARRDRGDIYKGPFTPRMPDRLVRRAIRGMLPRKKAKGIDALKRVSVFIGIPASVKGKAETLDVSKAKLKDQKYVTVLELCQWLGAKV